jgi:signal transduction histidine kinase/CheY-like chemotaxis protein
MSTEPPASELPSRAFAILAEVARAIASGTSLDDIVPALVRTVAPYLNCDTFLLFLKQGEGLRLHAPGPGRFSWAVPVETVRRAGQAACDLAENGGEPVYCRDTAADPRCRQEDEELAAAAIRSFAALPLYTGRERLGVLVALAKTATDFEKFAPWLDALAGEVALGVNTFFGRQESPFPGLAPQRELEERAELQARVRQVQKLETLGRLADGVAHDFNNLLMIISTCTQMLQEHTGSEVKARAYAERVQHACTRAAGLTRQLLVFTRKRTPAPCLLDLNPVAEEAVRLLKRLLSERVELIFLAGANLGPVKADPEQIVQLLMDLCARAQENLPQGGRLMIETRAAIIDAQDLSGRTMLVPGQYSMLVVMDTRAALPGKLLLARSHSDLALVYAVVRESGGYFWAGHTPGGGDLFEIYFPAASEPSSYGAHPEERRGSRSETILLVEDEEALRESVSEYLRLQGYTVLEAANGEAASQIAREHAGPIDLVITDVVMPKMDGPRLVGELAKSRPQAAVVYISGHGEHSVPSVASLPKAALLQKPFALKTLLRTIRKLVA